jgi:dTDP-4-dehydrorhamnose 3,5-epimerase
MIVEKLPLDGLLKITPKRFEDDRGFFFESFREDVLIPHGFQGQFVQDNHSRSKRNTLRGLHYQAHPGQAKWVRCTLGKIWDVAVDIRPGSPTFGKHFGLELDAANPTMMFIPIGFAHGFCVLSEWAEVQYKCSAYYDGAQEMTLDWHDSELAVSWPIPANDVLLSVRDTQGKRFADYRSSVNPS